MNAKELLKSLLPPILVSGVRAVRKLCSGQRHELPPFEYMGTEWVERAQTPGWGVEQVAIAQRSKWEQFKQCLSGTAPLGIAHELPIPDNNDVQAHNSLMTFAYVLAKTCRKKSRIKLLDWGGGLGHYGLFAKALMPEVEIEYHCVDFAFFAKHGQSAFPEAQFHSDVSDVNGEKFDLVIASGALQYAREWQTVLGALASLTEGYLLITRLPVLLHSHSYVVLQRAWSYGYETEYLSWSLNRDQFIQATTELGMALIREFLLIESIDVPKAPESCVFRGFLFSPAITVATLSTQQK